MNDTGEKGAPPTQHTRGRARSAALSAAIAVLCSACTTWQISTAPSIRASSFNAHEVRVTKRDGTLLTIYEPRVAGDSVFGWTAPPAKRSDAAPVALALGDVQRVGRRAVNGGRTALAVAGTAAGIALVGAALLITSVLIAWNGS
jgi:hypothetical protein